MVNAIMTFAHFLIGKMVQMWHVQSLFMNLSSFTLAQ